ncbi:MAG: hypothetical protein JWQ54_11 [Mucilaginibacter sp.]|nr:hypothetical protein [Mucilaginibacter sp.]
MILPDQLAGSLVYKGFLHPNFISMSAASQQRHNTVKSNFFGKLS